MVSSKQLEANRANARKSTGPRSQGGKARSRLNSWKHGLTAKMLIIVGECADDFERLRAELMEEHDPQSALVCELVQQLAGILWCLRRVPLFEAAILEARRGEVKLFSLSYHGSETTSIRLGQALIKDAAFSDALGKLARHQATLMNALTKTLRLI